MIFAFTVNNNIRIYSLLLFTVYFIVLFFLIFLKVLFHHLVDESYPLVAPLRVKELVGQQVNKTHYYRRIKPQSEYLNMAIVNDNAQKFVRVIQK